MKLLLLLPLLTLPLAVTAQRLEATASPVTYHVGNEKTPLYRNAADTLNPAKTYASVSPGEDITVVGQLSPNWAIVKRMGFLYITPIQKLIYGAAQSDKMAILSGRPLTKVEKLGIQALDAKNGFRDYHFGDNLSKFPNLKLESKDGQQKNYISTAENLQIGDAELKGITYSFYNDKLFNILIQAKGYSNTEKVKAAFEAQYGPGFQQNRGIKTYFWFGDRVTLYYDENSISREGNVIISDNGISAQIAADKKQAAKKAASDL